MQEGSRALLGVYHQAGNLQILVHRAQSLFVTFQSLRNHRNSSNGCLHHSIQIWQCFGKQMSEVETVNSDWEMKPESSPVLGSRNSIVCSQVTSDWKWKLQISRTPEWKKSDDMDFPKLGGIPQGPHHFNVNSSSGKLSAWVNCSLTSA